MAGSQKLVDAHNKQCAHILQTKGTRIWPQQGEIDLQDTAGNNQGKAQKLTISNEQLEKQTSALFRKYDQHTESLGELKSQMQNLDGQMNTLIKLMQDTLSHLPAAYEHKAHYTSLCEKIDKIERQYVNQNDLAGVSKEVDDIKLTFRDDIKSLKRNMWILASVFMAPGFGVAIKLIFMS